MKVTIKVTYNGDTKEFTGVEFPDGSDWSDIYDDFASTYEASAINEETGEEITL